MQQICSGHDCSDTHTVVSAVQRAAVTLRDDAAPTLSASCAPGSSGVVVRPLRRTVRLGRRVLIRGRVRGAPGAQVRIVRRVARSGSRWGLLSAVVTAGADGRFRHVLRGRVSQRLHVGVRVGQATTLTCSRVVRQRVRAASSLRASRRVVSGAARVVFRGRQRGGHAPAGGKLVVLQGYDQGVWRTFATARSDRRGRFRAGYRCRGRPGTYCVRAKVPVDASYPFALGHSRPIAVRVL